MAHEIVFAAEWEDRQGELRADPAALVALRRDSASRILPMWRGRPLVCGTDETRVVWLDPDHPVLADASDEAIFLGRHKGIARFAADTSSWVPEGIDEAAMSGFLDPTEYTHPALPRDHRFAELRAVMTRLPGIEAALASTARALMNWHRSHRFCSNCGHRSDMALGGWQRVCPSCRTPHFPRTDPVVIMLVQHGDSVLLGRSPGWPEGMYSALAGFVEPGESLEAAVRREVREETGVLVGDVQYVASQPWAWPNSLMLGFMAKAETSTITLDHELDDARWIPRNELAQVLAGTHATIRRPRSGAIAHELVSRWLVGTIGY